MPLKDYHHALMDGLWFVGEQLIPPCPAGMHGRRIYIPGQHSQSYDYGYLNTIRLEQLLIEYYHQDFFFFFKQMGNKLGKLLKIDEVTNTAI